MSDDEPEFESAHAFRFMRNDRIVYAKSRWDAGITGVVCKCGWKPQPKIAAMDLDEEQSLDIHVIAAQREEPLINRPITKHEHEIALVEARPGWVQLRPTTSISGIRHDPAYEQLTQEQTDVLILRELYDTRVPPSERADFERMTSIYRLDRNDVYRTHWMTQTQLGGVHSDPDARVWAFRAWGRRDLDWELPRRRRFDPPLQNIPRRRAPTESKPRATRMLHTAGCSDPACDGQCVDA